MRISLARKDVEKLFDEKKYDEIKKLLILSYTERGASAIINFFDNNISDSSYSFIDMKNYIVGELMNGIRNHNKDDDLENFVPFLQKRKAIKKDFSYYLTGEEKNYLNKFKKSIILCKKRYNGNITLDVFNTLKKIYEYDKEYLYTGIHRTNYYVDEIFKNGIKYEQSPSLGTHVQIEHSFDEMLFNISSCENYKNSTGCFIIKVPKKAINEKNEPIYYQDDNGIYLNPKYIVMFVPVSKKKILTPELNEEFSNIQSNIKEGQFSVNKIRM